MKIQELISLRIQNQYLAKEKFASAGDVVRWFGAMQAQDYFGALWAIGQRMNTATEGAIEQAIDDRKIIRTWPMRGTLHFVTPEDCRWMLKMLTHRIMQRMATHYRKLEIDSKVLTKSKKVFEKMLTGGVALTREELYDGLTKAKVNVEGERGIHLINTAAQDALICFGPRNGKQHTFVLLDEWIAQPKERQPDEALAELTWRYFNSHGPATTHDFAWWSGLTLAEVKRGIEMQSTLKCESIQDVNYWFNPESIITKIKSPNVNLLSWFDEFIISYKDREAAFDPATKKFIGNPKNGIYTPVILIDGKIAGNWKRTISGTSVEVETAPFRTFTASEKTAVKRQIDRLKKFLM